MSKPLVIVESPAKARTIGKFLGAGYTVKASMGHVRDLPRSGLHVYPDKGFEADWEPIKERGKVVADLRKHLAKADTVYLATDPDREGEAIAWHLLELLGLDGADGPAVRRVHFHEITKAAIQEAFEHPGEVNQALVDAYRARRILDRLVGYQLSELLWRKLTRGLSAGRVQSVAVKLVVDREREIRAFVPDEYWRVAARFGEGDDAFTAEFKRLDGKAKELKSPADAREVLLRAAGDGEAVPEPAAEEGGVAEKAAAAAAGTLAPVLPALRGGPFTLSALKQAPKRVGAKPPFKTSTLQQAAAGRYGFTAKRTMRVAQALYEGVELKGEGAVGLITYMRTDSFNVSEAARTAARKLIHARFGEGFVPEKPNFYRSREGAQEAHEAIRPTDPGRTPEAVRGALTEEQWKLYDLVWRRFLASQMAAAEYLVTTFDLERRGATFVASGRVTTFPGWTAVYRADREEDQALPALQEGQTLQPEEVAPSRHFTSPPRRYNEASLVKALEEHGIGRPSTYASILSTIVDRKYVDHGEEAEQDERRKHRGQPEALAAAAAAALGADGGQDGRPRDGASDDGPGGEGDGEETRETELADDELPAAGPRQRRRTAFFATHLGEVTTDLLEPQFGDLVNTAFTAQFETDLDRIAEGGLRWEKVVEGFYDRFKADLDSAREGMGHYRAHPVVAPDITCDKVDEKTGAVCGAPMVVLFNRGGAYLGCSRYPDCSNNLPLSGQRTATAEMTDFLCQAKDESGKVCGRPMEKKVNRWGRPFLACTGYKSKECKGAVSLSTKGEPLWPVETTVPCPSCGRIMNVKRSRRGKFLACPGYPKCRGTLNLPVCPHVSRGGKPCGLAMTEPGPDGTMLCKEHPEIALAPPLKVKREGAAAARDDAGEEDGGTGAKKGVRRAGTKRGAGGKPGAGAKPGTGPSPARSRKPAVSKAGRAPAAKAPRSKTPEP